MDKACLQDPLLFLVTVSKLPPAKHGNSKPNHTSASEGLTYPVFLCTVQEVQ